MRITPHKNRKRIVSISVGLVILIVILVTFWFLYLRPTTSRDPRTALNGSDPSVVSKDRVATSASSKDVDITKGTSEIPTSTNTSIAINTLKQEGGQVTYSAIIKGTGNGTCSALFSKDSSKPVSVTTPAIGATCEGSVSDIEFDMLGTWTLTLRYYVDNQQAVATKEMDIR